MTTIASATPGASRVPKADVTGKLLAGWFTAAVLLTDLGLGAGVAGDLVYGSGANTLARLGIGTAGRLLVAGASAPAWSDSGLSYASSVLTVAGSVPGTPSAGQVAIGGGVVKAGTAVYGADGSAAAPGVRTTTYAHGFYSSSATAIGLAVAGTAASTVAIPSANTGILTVMPSGVSATVEFATSSYKIEGGSNFGDLRLSAPRIRLYEDTTLSLTLDGGVLTAAVPIIFPNGNAAAPGIRTTTYAHGLHSASATLLGVSVAGARAAVFGAPNGTIGGQIWLEASTTEPGCVFLNSGNTASMILAPGAATTAGGQVRLYGSAHASKASYVEFTRGATVSAYFDGSGNLACNGTLSATSLTATGLTATYIPYATTGGLLTNDSGFSRISFSGGLYTNFTTTATGTGTGYSAVFTMSSNPSGDNNGTIHGAYFDSKSTAANASNYTSTTWGIVGFVAAAQHYGSGTAASVIGAGFGPVARPGCGVVAFMAGYKTLLQNLHTTQAVTEGNGAYIAPPSSAGGGYGTYKGINIAGTSQGTTNCIGLDIGAMTGTGPFAIRTAAGIVSIGDTTDATSLAAASMLLAGGLATAADKSILAGGKILSLGATHGIGYGTGAGGTVTQGTSRTTGVTLNKVTGRIALFTAAGSATPTTFTVTCSACAETDTVVVTDWSGAANTYIWKAKAANGSFDVTFWTTGGTASDAPGIHFNIIKGAIS